MQYIQLFPTTVGTKNIGRSFTGKELSFIRSLEFVKNHIGNSMSESGYVLEYEELKDLKIFCEEAVNDYFEDLYKPKQNLKLKITQSWINITDIKQEHQSHYHSNSIYSGVLYIETIPDMDKITFYRSEKNVFTFDTKEFTMTNARSWWVPVETGNILIFPSSLEHSVPKKEHSGLRISLAFNTFWSGTLGADDRRTELKLNGFA